MRRLGQLLALAFLVGLAFPTAASLLLRGAYATAGIFSSLTVTGLTKPGVVYTTTSSLLATDPLAFGFLPDGYSSGPTMWVGPQGLNPLDATLQIYGYGLVGLANIAHFQNLSTQGSTGGAIVELSSTPTGAAISSGSQLGSFRYGGSTDTIQTLGTGGEIDCYATQNWNASNTPMKCEFFTVPNGSTTETLAMTIDQDQSVTFAKNVHAPSLPTSCSGLPTGTLWNSSNTVSLCP
jgi:hypothetical protein